jgi:hypothetical protein
MKWVSHFDTYNDAPSGQPVYANASPDAWVVVDPTPAGLERAVTALRPDKTAILSWWEAVRSFPQSGLAEDVQAWLQALCLQLPENGSSAAWLKLLAMMRRESVILWPAGQLFLAFPGSPHFNANRRLVLCGNYLTDFETPWAKKQRAHDVCVFRSMVFSCSPAENPSDISGDALLQALRNFVDVYNERVASGDAVSRSFKQLGPYALAPFRAIEGTRTANGETINVLARAEEVLRASGHKGVQRSRWIVLSGTAKQEKSEIIEWRNLLDRYTGQISVKNEKALLRMFNRWLEYLADLKATPSPRDVTRETHIKGKNGFLSWLMKRYNNKTVYPSKILRRLHSFFEFCRAEYSIENPIWTTDIPRRGGGNNKSNKPLTPRDIIQMARTVVREMIAWAYRQVDGGEEPSFGAQFSKAAAVSGTADWLWHRDNLWRVNENVSKFLPSTMLRPCNFEKYLVTVRNEDSSAKRVVNPVYPTLLLTMLTVPIRMIQGRLLDSGEADEEIPTVTLVPNQHPDGSVTYNINVVWKKNSHRIAEEGRRVGALRKFDDAGQRSFLGLYVNTNKTQTPDASPGEDRGHEIPWENPELLYQICRLRDWQARFNPADTLLSRADLGKRESGLAPSKALEGHLPSYVHLFRVLDNGDVLHRQYPPTHEDCRHFFMAVMDEVEARLAELVKCQNAAEPDVKKHRQAPKLITKRDGRFPRVCIYTPHSLRLSGITAFAEAGVPAPIIAEFLSGHLTVLMTIYYSKFGPAVMTKVLDAVEDALEKGVLGAATVEASKMSVSQIETLFAAEDGTAFQSIKDQIPGFWKWFIDGICPNGMTKCAEGGPIIEGSWGKHGAVEGGARNCPLCRFWLTGPKFIAGQIIMANAALHKVRTLAMGLPELWEQRRDPAKVGQLSSIEDRIDRLEAEIDLTLRTLNARARLLEKSIAVARQSSDASKSDGSAEEAGLALITRMSEDEISVHARTTSELGYLEFMTRAVRLFPEIEAHDAPVALGVALDQLLDENGYRACLYRLPPDLRAKASIAFLDCLRAEAPTDIQQDEFIDEVARGQHPLFDFDAAKIEAEMSRAAGRAISLEQLLLKGGPALAPPAPGGGNSIEMEVA